MKNSTKAKWGGLVLAVMLTACPNNNKADQPETLTGTVYFNPETPKVGENVKLGIQNGNGTAGLYKYVVKKNKDGQITELHVFDNEGEEVELGVTPQDLEGYILEAIVTNADTTGEQKGSSNKIADPDPVPVIQAPTSIGLSFVSKSGAPAVGDFNVTVKSDDAHLPEAWTALVNSVKTALETTYASSDIGAGDRGSLRDVFGATGATVFLKNDLTKNWEVKVGAEKGVLYIKTSAASAITASSYATAVENMSLNTPSISITKAKQPAKGGVLLAKVKEVRNNLQRVRIVPGTKILWCTVSPGARQRIVPDTRIV